MQVEPIPQIVDSWLPVYVGILTGTAALLGALLAAITSYFVKKAELKHSVNEAKRTHELARLEDLHESLCNYIPLSAEVARTLEDICSHRGDEGRKAGAQEAAEALGRASTAYARISSLLMLYAPEFDAELLELRSNAMVMSTWAQGSLEQGSPDAEMFRTIQQGIADKCRPLQKKIQQKIRGEYL